MKNIFIKTIKITMLILFAVWLSITGLMLSFIPNDYLLVMSLSNIEADAEENKELEFFINLLPNSVAKWFIYNFEDDCFGDFTGNDISYNTLLVDIYYDKFPTDGMNIDKVQTKEAIIHFVNMGCSLNQVHPHTKWGPIHTAFLFSQKDPEFTKELVVLGADPLLELPTRYKEKFKGDNALSILTFKMNQKGNKSQVYEQVYNFVVNHNQLKPATNSEIVVPES